MSTHNNWGTPPPVADAVVQLLRELNLLDETTTVLEPSAGRGAFLYALSRAGIEEKMVAAVEINPDYCGGPAATYLIRDFLTPGMILPTSAKLVLGNPPFSGELGLRHVERAKQIAAETVAFILPLAMLELCNNRGDFWKDLSYVAPMPRYPFIDLAHNEVKKVGQRPNALFIWNTKSKTTWEQSYKHDVVLLDDFANLKKPIKRWLTGLEGSAR